MDTSTTLTALYSDITALTARGVEVNNKLAYVQKHGKLPELTTEAENNDLYAIKDQIKRLNDRICKTKKKLVASAKAKNPDRVNEWQMKVDMDEAARFQLIQQKKEIENGQRIS